ncbi:MAG: murein L,D-transpeptidase [Hyphomicrobium sp.]|uniref:L,D-transpeptidase family protein n=1 Tax=Hyphomicrobium sp. TaxID=82 RepID=UPI0013293A78|nr:murein L,D-transpeptidase family protein [Hyphomicrobium sp.]KAB2943942.1 MAG: murein L,D-transpeptidase [Hyphomicrobium sp.]MBZ0208850.1 murein L,D-transpeptidase [Hyphomicrobium sp.]
MVARHRRRWPVAITILGVLAAVAGLTYLFWPQIFAMIEDELIYAQKSSNWARYSAGESLPGTPDLKNLPARLASRNLKLGAPVFMRIFKREFELEMWMKRGDRFELFATYPICMWSGNLGPKLKQGDRQAPEGFYTVDSAALNPNSQYHRSFNLGFPNAFDRAHARTGSLLMVHGDCRSIGCYAMTDRVIDEVWSMLTSALAGGQKRVQVQVFPFRMTETNMSRHAANPNIGFWRQLQAGHDAFVRDHVPPLVRVCDGRYAIRPATGDSDGSAPIEVSCPAT